MRTLQFHGRRVLVHYMKKVLDEVRMVVELIALNPCDVLVSVVALGEDQLAEELGEGERCVIT